VTAHTLDDQAETVLMRLVRGTAYAAGMPPLARNLVRPLLDVRHAELVQYLERLGQTWREDASNEDVDRLRAWLRHEVVPLLRERFPGVEERLARHGELQADVAKFVRSVAGELLRSGGLLEVRELEDSHPAVQREAIRGLFDMAGVAPDSDKIERLRERLGSTHPYRLSIAPGKVLRIAYGRLELVGDGARPAEERYVHSAQQLPAGVPVGVLEYPDLVLRGRRPGDTMRLAGGSKSLARIMIDRKIPREEREGLQVLASGNEVLWAERIGTDGRLADPGEVDDDERFMRRALELAEAAGSVGEVPVGAVVVCGGKIVAEAHNGTRTAGDPTAHAELLALRLAAKSRGDWRLADCSLYVTLEPCPMCAGAVLESHLTTVVYGTANLRDGALGGVTDLLDAPWKRRVEVRGGVLAEEASTLLTSFFNRRRRD
jgi:tRNA(Ile)-lysidine synthase